MKNIQLYIPKVQDLWFRQQCMADPKTMSYNAGYDVHFEGYHFDTGCIDFPEDKWQTWYDTKMSNPDFFFAYIQDLDTQEYVGYVNFNRNVSTRNATMGIVILDRYRGNGYMKPSLVALAQAAKIRGVEKLTDNVPENRLSAMKGFYAVGFVKAHESKTEKFGQPEIVADLELDLRNKTNHIS